MDSMVDTFAHELAETITDGWTGSDGPAGLGWTDANGEENGDKCASDHSDLDIHATSTGMTSAAPSPANSNPPLKDYLRLGERWWGKN